VLVNNNRHSIPYESSKNVEKNIKQKISLGPQYVDLNSFKSMINYTNSAVDDENYYSWSRSDNDKDEEGDETKSGSTEIINNINQQRI